MLLKAVEAEVADYVETHSREVDEDGRGGNPHVERGEEMLDRLDEIRSGLLSGNINPRALEQLLRQVRAPASRVSAGG